MADSVWFEKREGREVAMIRVTPEGGLRTAYGFFPCVRDFIEVLKTHSFSVKKN